MLSLRQDKIIVTWVFQKSLELLNFIISLHTPVGHSKKHYISVSLFCFFFKYVELLHGYLFYPKRNKFALKLESVVKALHVILAVIEKSHLPCMVVGAIWEGLGC